jgi:hypothetical protein
MQRTIRRAIRQAGVPQWKHLFHSLRASGETDWCRTHPQHAVADWLGHSMAVSQKHYLQTTADMFDAASRVQFRVQSYADGGGQGRSNEKNQVVADESKSETTPVLPEENAISSVVASGIQDGAAAIFRR